MNKLTPAQIETAAAWWANALENPKFDNGDDSKAGGMSLMLAMMSVKLHTPAQVADFKNSLKEILTNENADHLSIGVDYHPDHLLSLALSMAGIQNSITVLPWKTYMSFRGGNVQVACGYRALPVELPSPPASDAPGAQAEPGLEQSESSDAGPAAQPAAVSVPAGRLDHP